MYQIILLLLFAFTTTISLAENSVLQNDLSQNPCQKFQDTKEKSICNDMLNSLIVQRSTEMNKYPVSPLQRTNQPTLSIPSYENNVGKSVISPRFPKVPVQTIEPPSIESLQQGTSNNTNPVVNNNAAQPTSNKVNNLPVFENPVVNNPVNIQNTQTTSQTTDTDNDAQNTTIQPVPIQKPATTGRVIYQ